MQWYETLSLFGFPTLAALIIGDIYARIKMNGKKFRERKKKERAEELTEVVEGVVNELLQPIKNDIQQVNVDIKLINSGIDSIKANEMVVLYKANRDALRNQLYQLYDRCELQGYKTNTDIDNEAHMFDSYTALGGNSGTATRHQNFVDMDTEAEYVRKKNKHYNSGIH